MKRTAAILLCLSTLFLAPVGLPQGDESAQTVSADFPNEERAVILRNMADLFELDLRLPDTLRGTTSLKIRNRNWRFFFDEVLRPVGYGWKEENGIIIVYDQFPERAALEHTATQPATSEAPDSSAASFPLGTATWAFIALTGLVGIIAASSLRPGIASRAIADPKWTDSTARLAAVIRVFALFIAFEGIAGVGGMAIYSAAFHANRSAGASALVSAGMVTSNCAILLFLATGLVAWRFAPSLALKLAATLQSRSRESA